VHYLHFGVDLFLDFHFDTYTFRFQFQDYLPKEMFGDLFLQRSDYSSGIFYATHCKVLSRDNKLGSSLEVPDDFKNKRQMRHVVLNKNLKQGSHDRDEMKIDKVNFHINFQKNKHEIEEDASKKFKKAATLIKNTLIIEHYSSILRRDWVEETQAGCKLWVNKATGEVSSDCPWAHSHYDQHHVPLRHAKSQLPPISSGHSSSHVLHDRNALSPTAASAAHALVRLRSNSGNSNTATDMATTEVEEKQHESETAEYGTGALVYDPSELNNLFAILDESKGKKPKASTTVGNDTRAKKQ